MSLNHNRRTAAGAIGIALALGSAATLTLAKPKARVIKMVAKKFVFVPGKISVKKGETVVFQLTAPEVPMGFSLPDFGKRIDVVPGKVATLELTPDKAGTFTFLCDIFCGSGHEDMNGTLVVTE
jgi:cytochrome c oxidase subunit 2